MKFVALNPAPHLVVSPSPWKVTDDGTVVAADGYVVCVLGSPLDGLQEQDITNGALILAAGLVGRRAEEDQTAAHSPAPFRVEETRQGFLIVDYIGDSIAALAGRTGDHPREEQRANANLFAASPSMLQALKLARAVRPTNWDDAEDAEALAAWTAVDLAIERGEGRL